MLGQIQQDNPDIRGGMSESLATICKEENEFFDQVLYIHIYFF